MTLCPRCLRPIRLHVVCLSCNPDTPPEEWPTGEGALALIDAFSPDVFQWGMDHILPRTDESLTDEEAVVWRVWNRGWVREEGLLYVAGLVQHLREKQQKAEESARFAAANAEKELVGSYVGKVGERCAMTLTCTDVKPMGENQFGPRYLLLFSGPEGERVIWWTGSGKFDPQPGMTYSIVAKVEKHAPYSGERQTTISRPKVV